MMIKDKLILLFGIAMLAIAFYMMGYKHGRQDK